jgi:hypothetical protein
MRITTFITAMLIIMAVSAQAYMVRGGLNLSRLIVDPDFDNDEDLKFKPGFHLSVVREFPRSYGNMHAGIVIESRGVRSEYRYEDEYVVEENETEVALTYIIVPLGMQFENLQQKGTRTYFAVRLVPSFLYSAELSYEYRYEDDYDEETGSDSDDIERYVKGFDLLAEAEVGLSMPRTGSEKRWLLGAALGYGLTNGFEAEEDAEDIDVKNFVVRVFVGMEF